MKHLIRSALIASALLASAAPALADARTEAYVQKNASEVLQSLNDPKLSAAERTAAFSGYMDKFTDLDAVSNFVIGKYSRRFTEAELTKYRKAFRDYALAVYEYQLDAYRGEAVVVGGGRAGYQQGREYKNRKSQRYALELPACL